MNLRIDDARSLLSWHHLTNLRLLILGAHFWDVRTFWAKMVLFSMPWKHHFSPNHGNHLVNPPASHPTWPHLAPPTIQVSTDGHSKVLGLVDPRVSGKTSVGTSSKNARLTVIWLDYWILYLTCSAIFRWPISRHVQKTSPTATSNRSIVDCSSFTSLQQRHGKSKCHKFEQFGVGEIKLPSLTSFETAWIQMSSFPLFQFS